MTSHRRSWPCFNYARK